MIRRKTGRRHPAVAPLADFGSLLFPPEFEALASHVVAGCSTLNSASSTMKWHEQAHSKLPIQLSSRTTR
jgi:hypothetical protein